MVKFPRHILFLLPLLALCAAAPARGDTFLDALDDVPVMPGLAEETDAAIAFETAAGRIVTARASAPARPGLDIGAVLAFYGATLPALGWRAETPSRFLRDGEVLTLGVELAGGRIGLRFELRPSAADPAPAGAAGGAPEPAPAAD